MDISICLNVSLHLVASGVVRCGHGEREGREKNKGEKKERESPEKRDKKLDKLQSWLVQ